ncbi:MAG: hypothetical protein K0U80_05845 [Actinomycetia bacterium]|nr:hypothetical protein [Actinomycetes bacterium]
MMLGLSLAVVVALVLGLVVWKASGHGSGGSGSASDGDVDRTVGLLRERDPVCDEWGKYADELAEHEEQWAAVNKGIPATKWTPEQREIFESVGRAMSAAADQFESILPDARNVVLQELIAQTIVYLRAYVERIPNYVESDGLIAGVAGNFSNAATYMCSAVPLVSAGDALSLSSSVQKPSELEDFMKVRDPVCDEFVALVDRQNSALIGWAAIDSTVNQVHWTSKQRTLYDAVRKTITRNLTRFREIASLAKGRVMGDLMATQNAYMEAFADAIPSYAPEDQQLWAAVNSLGGGLAAACESQL